jgi:hypothetical protein
VPPYRLGPALDVEAELVEATGISGSYPGSYSSGEYALPFPYRLEDGISCSETREDVLGLIGVDLAEDLYVA